MMRTARLLFAVSLAALTLSCNNDSVEGKDNKELTSINAGLPASAVTKATNYSPYVGRGIENANSRYLDFNDGDEIIITKMARTSDPIPALSYSGFGYRKETGIWSRIQGGPTKLYWSDSVHPHTFVGYSKPSEDFPFTTTDETPTSSSVYSGSIGYTQGTPGTAATADTPEIPATPNIADLSDNDKIKAQDILLLYNTEQRAGDTGEATLIFHHGLACVRVIIDKDDYSSQLLDRQVSISDLILKNMPVEYTWNQTSSGVTVKPESVTADFKTWQPSATVNTFFTIAVPGEVNFDMEFTVTAPDPLYPDNANKTVQKKYKANKNGVILYPGKCTTLNVHLNHEGEEITIGASYQDWEFIETPDFGTLKKNVTFINKKDLSYTIATDQNATQDDATWLYISGEQVYDIYGNDGTESDPYKIATANQLLSFAQEVASGRSFDGKFIMLDASLTLQEVKATSNYYTWPMIGAAGKPFQGTFIGGGRTISKIYGNPLFCELGENAHIENLVLLECLTSGNVLANSNAGSICAVRIEGNSQYAFNTNTGAIFASSITGSNTKALVKGNGDGSAGGDATNIEASYCGGTTDGYMYSVSVSAESVKTYSATNKTKAEMITQGFVTTLNSAISSSQNSHRAMHSFLFIAGNYPKIQ